MDIDVWNDIEFSIGKEKTGNAAASPERILLSDLSPSAARHMNVEGDTLFNDKTADIVFVQNF